MSKTRKHYSKSFKSQVVLEALKEREPLEVLAKKYELTPQQISTWKSQAIANISNLFSKDNNADKSKEADIQMLYAQIGELKVQNDFLKKKLQ